MLPRGLFLALTVLISLVWAVNVAVGFINPALRDPTINAIFAIVVGAIYALGRKNTAPVSRARRRIAAVIAGEPDADTEQDESEKDDQGGEPR